MPGRGIGVSPLVRSGTTLNQNPLPDGMIVTTLGGKYITSVDGKFILTVDGFVPINAMRTLTGDPVVTI